MTTALALGALAGGCNERHILGNVDGGMTYPIVDGASVISAAPFDAGYPGDVNDLGPRQSWTGYVESYQFASGSDAVHMSFSSDPTGVIVGTVTLGSGTPPPPATDPEAFYPPGVPGIIWSRGIEGFPFTIANGTLVGSRLRLNIYQTELMNSWCILQTPVSGSNSCVPNWASQATTDGTVCSQISPTGQVIPVSCAKLQFCEFDPVCTCTAAGCTQKVNAEVSFDVSLSGTAADGSVTGSVGEHNVRLTKDP